MILLQLLFLNIVVGSISAGFSGIMCEHIDVCVRK